MTTMTTMMDQTCESKLWTHSAHCCFGLPRLRFETHLRGSLEPGSQVKALSRLSCGRAAIVLYDCACLQAKVTLKGNLPACSKTSLFDILETKEDGTDRMFRRHRAWKPSIRRLSACSSQMESMLYNSFGSTIAVYSSIFLCLEILACDQQRCIALKIPFASPMRLDTSGCAAPFAVMSPPRYTVCSTVFTGLPDGAKITQSCYTRRQLLCPNLVPRRTMLPL